MTLNKALTDTIEQLSKSIIAEERKEVLQPLIDYVQTKVSNQKNVNLNFICTHNSRRSHLSQVWAQIMAAHFDVNNVYCYSGGTEATAVYPQVITALRQAGFEVNKIANTENSIYSLKYSDNCSPIIAFSKTYDDTFNPMSDFGAVMTCSHADENCPFIAGAEQRIPVRYNDPKEYDDTSQKAAKYQERSLQIANEMYYVFSQINK